ncbi:uncharacterized protein B4U80_00123, partial [Leptotrombidium deliense]
WHSAFNKAVGKSHPRLYQFIDTLKNQQLEFEIVARQVDNGESTVSLRRKYIQLNEKIKKLTDMFDSGSKSRIEYLDSIGYNVAKCKTGSTN